MVVVPIDPLDMADASHIQQAGGDQLNAQETSEQVAAEQVADNDVRLQPKVVLSRCLVDLLTNKGKKRSVNLKMFDLHRI